ncbi:MAG: ribbon-helix-helix protein, CopG family [Burkholderiales bacterium]|nr:ribbon-helix-helix protein, CopG family [Burkholderiales bacterium]
MSMKTVTVKLPEPLAAWLARRSRELGHPQSDLIREALERLRQGGAGDSCHDAFADVCGSVRGPKDLSTNPRHLVGFGE